MNDLPAIITALAALVGAATPIVLEIIRRGDSKSGPSAAGADKAEPTARERVVRRFAISSVWGIAVTSICVIVLIVWLPKVFEPSNGRQRTMTKSWGALDNKRWEEAAKTAAEIIDEFGGNAFLEQEKLERANEPPPPWGDVPKDLQTAIHARGVLNDVGAAYFIRGRALEQAGRNSEARKAYQEAARLTYARTWNPSEKVFWSTAEGALGRLKTLPP